MSKKIENKNLDFLVHDISVPLNMEFDAVLTYLQVLGITAGKKI